MNLPPIRWKDRLLCLKERTSSCGFDRHYVYHTAWAARRVAERKPEYHIDISSSLYFCSLVSAFVPVRYYEFRPPELSLDNLTTHQADLFNLPFADDSIESLSCMHVVEHIGLGRYGDSLDPKGDRKAIEELKRIIAKDGMLLFVVPIGASRIRFNADRSYTYQQITDYFAPLPCLHYAFIPDDSSAGPMAIDPPENLRNNGKQGCGCFLFTKKVSV
jgi:SAM-dependent methyltransferase